MKSEKYYLDKLSLFMKESSEIVDTFKFYYQIIKNLDDKFTAALNLLDVFDENYDISDKDDILDKIGALYGVTRVFSTYHLSNKEFFELIKTRIIQNFFDGSFEQVKQYYEKMNFKVVVTTAGSCLVNVSLIDDGNVSEQEQQLFKDGFFCIESMGIRYEYQVVNLERIAFFDNENLGWDVGELTL